MPLSQRLPKLPGFKNPFHKLYAVVNLSKLSRFPDRIDGRRARRWPRPAWFVPARRSRSWGPAT